MTMINTEKVENRFYSGALLLLARSIHIILSNRPFFPLLTMPTQFCMLIAVLVIKLRASHIFHGKVLFNMMSGAEVGADAIGLTMLEIFSLKWHIFDSCAMCVCEFRWEYNSSVIDFSLRCGQHICGLLLLFLRRLVTITKVSIYFLATSQWLIYRVHYYCGLNSLSIPFTFDYSKMPLSQNHWLQFLGFNTNTYTNNVPDRFQWDKMEANLRFMWLFPYTTLYMHTSRRIELNIIRYRLQAHSVCSADCMHIKFVQNICCECAMCTISGNRLIRKTHICWMQ